MSNKPEVTSDGSPALGIETRGDATAHTSGAVLKASAIAPRDIIDPLPEDLLRWLHDDFEGDSGKWGQAHQPSMVDFESVVVDRLFPLRDSRAFVRRLRRHCQATALAACLLAELTETSSKVAGVCGWLHDLGLAACIKHVDEVAVLSDNADLLALWPTILRSSAQHGIRLASRWRLPSAVRHAIRDHSNYATFATPNRIAATTYVAEYVATIIGYDFLEPTSPAALERAIAAVECGGADILGIAARTERLMRRAGPVGAVSAARNGPRDAIRHT